MDYPPDLPGRFEMVLPLPATAATDINVVVTHGRGRPPRAFRWRLVCLMTETGANANGYAPGDEMEFKGYWYSAGVYNVPTGWANAAQLGIAFNASTYALYVAHKTTNADTALSTPLSKHWAIKVYAEW